MHLQRGAMHVQRGAMHLQRGSMHACNCMHAILISQNVHVEEHACNLDLAKCMWQSMHAIFCARGFACMQAQYTSTWLKDRLTPSIYTWHLHACESLRYFLKHFFEFCMRRHQRLLIASARLDFRQKLDSDFDPVLPRVTTLQLSQQPNSCKLD